jgi:hypothetical protein
MVSGVKYRGHGVGFRVQGSGKRAYDIWSGSRVEGPRIRAQCLNLEFRV